MNLKPESPPVIYAEKAYNWKKLKQSQRRLKTLLKVRQSSDQRLLLTLLERIAVALENIGE